MGRLTLNGLKRQEIAQQSRHALLVQPLRDRYVAGAATARTAAMRGYDNGGGSGRNAQRAGKTDWWNVISINLSCELRSGRVQVLPTFAIETVTAAASEMTCSGSSQCFHDTSGSTLTFLSPV
jgi:hypothetical protein